MAAISCSLRLAPLLGLAALAACETAPLGPGKTVDSAESSIKFTHPLYPDVEAEYTQRSGGYNSQVETATFLGKSGVVFVTYHSASGDTYISAPNLERIVENMGSTPEQNQIKSEGTLPDTFPAVEWVSYSITGDNDTPMSCVTIQRNGDSAGRAGSYTSSLINATECRGAYMEMTEREAAALSGSVRIE